MKRTLFISILCCLSIACFAQQAVISFEKSEHNFGQIKEVDGKVTTVFTFTNEGTEPLVISNVRASCGCTTPMFTRTPIEAGKTGTITVTYNPAGRPGRFTKSITVTSNATTPTTKLYIKGEVIPKEAKAEDKYPVQMEGLRFTKKEVHFGNVQNTKDVTRTLEYANFSTEPITVEIYQNEKANGLSILLTQTTVQPKQTGILSLNIDGKLCKTFGMQSHQLYIVVNGKRVLTDNFKISITANIVEDFSRLTPEQRQQAPILELSSRKIEFGTIKANGKYTQEITLKNVGINPLLVHRLHCRNNATNLTAKANKTNIKSGKAAAIQVALDTNGLKPANYARQIEIITNDPQHPRIFVTITWRIEE